MSAILGVLKTLGSTLGANTSVCSTTQMRCGDGKCIFLRYRCDKVPDCPEDDAADEKDCGQWPGIMSNIAGDPDLYSYQIIGPIIMKWEVVGYYYYIYYIRTTLIHICIDILQSRAEILQFLEGNFLKTEEAANLCSVKILNMNYGTPLSLLLKT